MAGAQAGVGSGVRDARAVCPGQEGFTLVEPRGLEPLTPCLQRPGTVLTERCCRPTETVTDAHDHIEYVGRCCTLLLQVQGGYRQQKYSTQPFAWAATATTATSTSGSALTFRPEAGWADGLECGLERRPGSRRAGGVSV